MKQLKTFGDRRMLESCAFCGQETGTRDHCPSRVLLDEPYPENLPVVPACLKCNASFSADEQYLACLLSCVVAGSTEPHDMPREKVRRILTEEPDLRRLIEHSRSEADGRTIFNPEHVRVRRILIKLAQGHALHELHTQCSPRPDYLVYEPISEMSVQKQMAFEVLNASTIWPEVGSRAMQRIINGGNDRFAGWLEVQPARYRYSATQSGYIEVRIVIHEYLACRVRWD